MPPRNRADDHASLTAIKREIDNYEQTIQALLSLAHDSCWDRANNNELPGTKFSFGRKMDISGKTVTPDLVVQRSPSRGIVCEAKKNIAKNEEDLKAAVEQAEAYMGKLDGWYNDKPMESDVVLLTHQMRAVRVKDYVENKVKSGRRNLAQNFAVVSFVRSAEVDTFINLRKEFGHLSDRELDSRWTTIVGVPLDRIIERYGHVKFYDSPPPKAYLLQIIWEHILSPKAVGQQPDPKGKFIPIQVRVKDLTGELAQYFSLPRHDQRDPEIPQIHWVSECLEILRLAGMADKAPGKQDTYITQYKRKRGDVLLSFHRLVRRIEAKRRKREPAPNQMDLSLS